jgi:flavin reductase (DIM6/NTAB) family NADH-FMN oxidoreductase RutF
MNTEATTLEKDLRRLMLQAAQPVVVITTQFREGGRVFRVTEDDKEKEKISTEDLDMMHGATLSSFASVAMSPYPILSFSLQLPSRLATALITMRRSTHRNKELPDFVLNILSFKQADLAIHFSRPDLHPHPFRSLSSDRYSFVDDQPMLVESVGSISCAVISSINLHTLEDAVKTPSWDMAQNGGTSNLFLAKVLRINGPKESEEGVKDSKPLIYHQKGFTTIT